MRKAQALGIVILVVFTQILVADSGVPEVIPQEERLALIAIYNSTGGDHWKNKENWLGAQGTECHWYGIQCRPHLDEWQVSAIDLSSNNLKGPIPIDIMRLKGLTLLLLHNNEVSLPEEVLARWDAGELDLRFGTQYSDISRITLTESASVMCCWQRFVLTIDGSVVWFHERCKPTKGNAVPHTYCEVKKGKTYDYDRLARFLERNGFFAETTVSLDKGVWIDTGNVRIVAERNGKIKTIEIGAYGDGTLAEWSFDKAIRGVALESEWSQTHVIDRCPYD